jgi:hypothetical protein
VRRPLYELLRLQGADAHAALERYCVFEVARLEKLFAENGNWASVRVTPSSGTSACLGMLISIYLDLAFRRIGLGVASEPIVAAIDTVAMGIDGRSASLREPGPSGVFARFHVVAEAPR